MITEIGIVCGEILTLMEENNSILSVKEVIEYLGKPEPVVLMSVGWLIREGMVQGKQYQDDFFIWPEIKRDHPNFLSQCGICDLDGARIKNKMPH